MHTDEYGSLGQPMNDRRRIHAIMAASSGNLVEWFDFYVYAFTSLYFAPAFFPAGDATTQLLHTAAVFAAGFLMRPLGGWLFGCIADRRGRKKAMLLSVCMMCGGSLMIACLPVHATIGSLAPALLLFARLLQGLSVGGEYGASATYMSEVATRSRRGFFGSFHYVTLIAGQLLAVLTVVVLQQLLNPEQLRGWGWRIPFFMGAAAALVVLYLRRSLPETANAASRASDNAGRLSGLMRHKAAFFTVLAFTAGGSLYFYTFTTYMQKYLVNSAGMDPARASLVMTCALSVFMLLQPLFGALSDRIGRRVAMLWFSGLATVCAVPILRALNGGLGPWPAFLLILAALIIASFYTSISGLVKAALFPAQVRALGVGFSYALGNALFGGSAEYVALWLKAAGLESGFFWYVSGMSALVFLVSLWMPDPDRAGYLDRP